MLFYTRFQFRCRPEYGKKCRGIHIYVYKIFKVLQQVIRYGSRNLIFRRLITHELPKDVSPLSTACSCAYSEKLQKIKTCYLIQFNQFQLSLSLSFQMIAQNHKFSKTIFRLNKKKINNKLIKRFKIKIRNGSRLGCQWHPTREVSCKLGFLHEI